MTRTRSARAIAGVILICAATSLPARSQDGRFNLLDALSKAKFLSHTPEEAKKELAGKLIGLYFTAHWCSPCRAFTPKLVRFRNEHKDTFQFVMMSWDKDLASQTSYVNKAKMNAPAVRFDDPLIKKVSSLFRVNGVPTLLIFDTKGQVLTSGGREHLITAIHGARVSELAKSEAGKTWLRMVEPIQAKMRAERDANLSSFEYVFTKYKDFPHIQEFRDLFGYPGMDREKRDLLTRIGRTIADDWSVKKRYLYQMPAVAREMKPSQKGWRSLLEAQGGYCFAEIGRHVADHPEIKELLIEFVKGDKLQPQARYLSREWALCGLVTAAITGDKNAYDMVVNIKKHVRISHYQLKVFPLLYEPCRNLNAQALSLAYDLYVQDPYYVYVAFQAFYPAAYKGNPKALDALAAIIKTAKKKNFVDAARKVLTSVAGEGNDHAKGLLKAPGSGQ